MLILHRKTSFRKKAPLIPFVLAIVLLFTQACSIATRVDYEDGEGILAKDFFHNLRNNKTDTDWVMSQLGEPLHAQDLENSVNVYTWQLSRSAYKHASLLIVLRYNTLEREKEYLHVVSVDGIVKKHWLDGSAAIQQRKLDDFVTVSASASPASTSTSTPMVTPASTQASTPTPTFNFTSAPAATSAFTSSDEATLAEQ